MVRDHMEDLVDREATVVRVDGVALLKVEDEVGQATRMLPALTENLTFFPFFWHIPTDVRLGGDGCREDFCL